MMSSSDFTEADLRDAELHREANDAYFGEATGDEDVCPACGSDDVSRAHVYKRVDAATETLTPGFACNKCGSEWTE